MKRTRQHEIETESKTLLRNLLPSSWIIRDLPEDYGVDFEIELVDTEILTGKRLWLQLKGTELCERVRKQLPLFVWEPDKDTVIRRPAGHVETEAIRFRVETKLLDYSLGCPFPLLLFVGSLQEEEMFWLPLRDHLELSSFKPDYGWEGRETATLYLPEWNRLTYEAKRNYRGLRWYALEPTRMYDFAKIHQWAYQSSLWDDVEHSFGFGQAEISFSGTCKDPDLLLLTTLERFTRIFGLVLGLETIRDAHSEIGVSTRGRLESAISCTHRAISLVKQGPPFPCGLGPLVSEIFETRHWLMYLSHHSEHGRQNHILSEMSSGALEQYRIESES